MDDDPFEIGETRHSHILRKIEENTSRQGTALTDDDRIMFLEIGTSIRKSEAHLREIKWVLVFSAALILIAAFAN